MFVEQDLTFPCGALRCRSNWVDIELKSYEDIAVLAQETAPNASGFGGRSLGLPGVQLPTEQQRDMRRAVRQPAFHSHAMQQCQQQISD